MRRNIFSFVIPIFLFIIGVQSVSGQEKKKMQHPEILKEVNVIQSNFSKNISQYDFKKDSALYVEKYRFFHSEKMKNLKNLYQSWYEKHPLIGKKEFEINNGKSTEATDAKLLENEKPQAIQKEYPLIEIAEIENYQQMLDLKKYIPNNFPTNLFMDGYEDRYKTVLTFYVDVDGKFKKIKYRGSNEEFNLISALYLYSVGSLDKPILYKNTPLMAIFSQPISLILE